LPRKSQPKPKRKFSKQKPNPDNNDLKKIFQSFNNPASVASSFRDFVRQYHLFRKAYGLRGSIKNVHEVCNSMTDKHGRVCRYVKHQSRQDPKSDWPVGMIEAMMGYMVYMVMLLNYYEINSKDLESGIINELEKALQQHG